VLQLFSGIGSVASSVDDGGGVAYMAHVGGFVMGFLLTLVLRGRGVAMAR
jgi:membrane associated rhomboid family serine protease